MMTSNNNMSSSSVAVTPCLVWDLRGALAVLYGLHQHQHNPKHHGQEQQQRAHDYLMKFQSRNGRRKITSSVQNHIDTTNNNNGGDDDSINGQQHDPACVLSPEDVGSAWLACVHILLRYAVQQDAVATKTVTPVPTSEQQQQQHHINYAEALFVAQTLVHRLRRVKLSEAIDVEFEPLPTTTTKQQHQFPDVTVTPQQILQQYCHWISSSVDTIPQGGEGAFSQQQSSLTNILQNYHPAEILDDDRIKGEISLLAMTFVIDSLTRSAYILEHHRISVSGQHQQGHGHTDHCGDPTTPIRSLLTTCSMAVAVIAARLRYTPISFPNPSPQTEPIVSMILRCIHMIHQQQDQQQQQPHAQSIQKNIVLLRDSRISLYFTCLTSLPEAILAGSNADSGGGAYGRLSLDPRCYMAVATEIKTNGISDVWYHVRHLIMTSDIPASPSCSTPSSLSNASALSPSSVRRLLELAESWARHVPIPFEFVNQTIPLVKKIWTDRLVELRHHHQQQHSGRMKFEGLDSMSQSAMLYWITMMESGTKSIEEVLASSLIQSKNGSNQANKKRQSSKSKKREAKIIGDRTTEDLLSLAQNEVKHRGDVACHLAWSTWDEFSTLLQFELHVMSQHLHKGDSDVLDDDDFARGDGPVGAITACANACLPHLVLAAAQPGCSEVDVSHMILVFKSISEAVSETSKSPSRHIRSFIPETIYHLHESLIANLSKHNRLLTNESLREAVVAHFHQCSMNLASQCGYPPHYFHDLTAINDDDLEVERNDARDVLRAVALLPANANPAIFEIELAILFRLLQACAQPIIEEPSSIFPETALHAFSALAKPLQNVALTYGSDRKDIPQAFNDIMVQVLTLATDTYAAAGNYLVKAFSTSALHDILPLSRLYNLAVASLAPMFSCLVEKWPEKIVELMKIGIETAVLSLLQIPELVAPSALRQTRYDIRGAMRTPGGEDHVGVLALMRLSDESESLSLAFLKTKDGILLDLCGVYDELKKMEERRGPGVIHGIGVLPKSRRILLSIICRLLPRSNDQSQVVDQLRVFFENARESIISLISLQDQGPSPESLFWMCEHTLDLASFSPTITKTLFEDNGETHSRESVCVDALQNVVSAGYRLSDDPGVPQEILEQWNRLRAALFILCDSISPEVPPSAANTIFSLVEKETEAVIAQCDKGPRSTSRIFNIEVISDDGIPPGLFIQVLSSALDKAIQDGKHLSTMKSVIGVLHHSRQRVLESMSCSCPTPAPKAFYDPRPVIGEIWFFAMVKLSKVIVAQQGVGHPTCDAEMNSMISDLMIDTCAVSTCMVLRSSLGKTSSERLRSQQGMILDGPQGLGIMEFYAALFDLGPEILAAASRRLVDVVPVQVIEDPDSTGVAIILAALFRAAAGGLPPWAVESTPVVYSSLFRALNRNSDHFRFLLSLSTILRLSPSHNFGGIEPGGPLAGPNIFKLSDKSRKVLLDQAYQIANADDASGWRRLKAVIKQASGGKKKDTDFNQKPALTRFETLDRV